ncbi:UL16-binding protein 3-like [Hippopotamus amphibius kiboko]|uniref:UL16-binding protein 3-like n=1 Tax=Hippopotamus amphibius kiboko TaxID=575201 RepID=UPI002597F82C|nr:UL16-binding protein 3-like [Hippopotamus amphibius kiboko]
MCLHFDTEDGHWTVVHPAGRRMKEKWENDRAVTGFFKTVSMGDCRAWLQDFLVHWEKMLKKSASPTTAPPAAPSRATALKPIAWIITWILPVVLTYFIITGILS